MDNKTGLTWQRTAPPQLYSVSDAITYCQSNAGGLPGVGWRVPNEKELFSLVSLAHVLGARDPAAFPGEPTSDYWSATTYVGDPTLNWFISFRDGSTWAGTQAATRALRCVR